MFSATMIRFAKRAKRISADGGDEGFSVLEAVVALSILLITSVAILSLLVGAMKVQIVNRARTSASAYAQRELERIKSWEKDDYMRIINDYGGRYVKTPFKVGTYTFYETIDVGWAASEPNKQSGNTGSPDYFRVSVEIAWDNMGPAKPVVATTYIAPPGDIFTKNSGHVKVTVLDHNGSPVSGARLYLYNKSLSQSWTLYSGSDGTQLFAYLQMGTYELTGSLSGYIASNRTPYASAFGIPVDIKTTTPVEIQLAPPANLTLNVVDTTGQPVTSTVTASVALNGYDPIKATGNSPILFSNLWPGSYDIAAAVYDCGGPPGNRMRAATGAIDGELLSPGSNTVDLVVRQGSVADFTVTVVGDNFVPESQATVVATDACGQVTNMPNTGADGTSFRAGVPVGPHSVRVIPRNPPSPYKPSTKDVIVSDPATSVAITVAP